MRRRWKSIGRVIEGPADARSAPRLLTASEVGAFVFCPEAWYLQRRGARQAATAETRKDIGIRAHRRIGRDTDRLLKVGDARVLLLLAVVLLVVLQIAQIASATSVLRP
jgi:hypothetical protein